MVFLSKAPQAVLMLDYCSQDEVELFPQG